MFPYQRMLPAEIVLPTAKRTQAHTRLCVPLSARSGPYPQDFWLIQFLRISIGTGKTTVVFFSTPISVRVCR